MSAFRCEEVSSSAFQQAFVAGCWSFARSRRRCCCASLAGPDDGIAPELRLALEVLRSRTGTLSSLERARVADMFLGVLREELMLARSLPFIVQRARAVR